MRHTKTVGATLHAAFRKVLVLSAWSFAGVLVVIQACTSENITDVVVTSVTVTPSSTTITVGETAQFEARVVDENGVDLQGAGVVWSVQSDDGDIASIDGNGLVTALGEGTATVRAEFRGASDQAALTIDPAPRIGVAPSSVTLYAGIDGPVPEPAVVQVTNGGSGPLGSLATSVSYPGGEPEGWLDAALAGSSAPTQLEISALSTGMPVGEYSAVVTLTSPDAPDEPNSLPVTLSVTGFTLTETDGATVVTEDGGTDMFSAVLDSEPTSNVVLDVVSGDVGAVTVSPSSLTFTPANWDTPQAVTVTGVDDAVPAGERETQVTVFVDPGLSDPAYGPAVDRSVMVTTLDDDETGFVVTETNGETVVTETGGTDTLAVVLRTRPSTNVVFLVTGSDPTEAAAAPETLTFTSTNWNVPQIVVVTGVDDDVVDGPQTSTVTIAVDDENSDAEYQGLPDQSVTVTTLDNDGAGVVVIESQGSTVVTEAGGTDAFTVQLTSQPTANVLVRVTSSDTGEARVSPSTLTFTPGDWSTPQPVAVTGVDDDVIDGDVVSTITVAVDAGASAAEYAGAPDQFVEVTTLDDDVAGFIIEESGGGTAVSESGTSDTFTVVLTAEPSENVTLGVTSSDLTEVTVAPAGLTFTAANWDQPQTVTVTGVDDDLLDGNQLVPVVVSVDTAVSDPAFAEVADQSAIVTNADNDSPGFTVTSAMNPSVAEAGGSAPITLVLNTQPASQVVLTFTVGDTLAATVDPLSLTFAPANWNVPQSVTMTGVGNDVADGDRSTTVVVAVDAATSDDAFDGVESQTVTVTVVDDDVAGFTVADTTGLEISETGTTDAFTVVLDSEPVGEVLLDVTSGDPGEVTVAPVTLTFGAANWNVAQTVTLTGVDDALVDGPQVSAITVSVRTAGSDAGYAEVPAAEVNATTLDDEVGALVLADTVGLVVDESGTTDTFLVSLNAAPVGSVDVEVASGDEGEVVVRPLLLTFTPTNWSTPQVVTLTGVDDDVVDGPVVTTVTVAVVDGSSQAEFAGLMESVTVTTTDNDGAGLTLVGTDGLQVTEGGSTDTFTVLLGAAPTTNVVLSVTSGDTGEVTAGPPTLTFTPSNWNQPQTVTLTGVDDQIVDGSQTTPITVAVVDANSDSAFAGLSATAEVMTIDDDVARLELTDTTALQVSEDGDSARFTVALSAYPDSAVVVTLRSVDLTEVTVSPARLTFGSGTWNVPQSVTVTGVNDDVVDGNTVTSVVMEVEAGSDTAFTGVRAEVSVTNMDNDAAGITVMGNTSPTVTEGGDSAVFTVRLNTQPPSNVVLGLFKDSNGDRILLAPSTLTFTNVNWATPQDVTVTAVDNDVVDGNVQTQVLIAVNQGQSDPAYQGVPAQEVDVSVVDNDVAGFTLVDTDSLSVTEAGGTDAFGVVLDRAPLGDVVFTVSSADTGEVTVAPDTLTFTPGNWNIQQNVTLTGVDDDLVDGDQVTQVTIAANVDTSDPAFAGLASQAASVTTVDDEVAGFVLADTAGLVVGESPDSTDTFRVVLTSRPLTNVTLNVVSGDTTQATVTPSSVTFTTDTWNDPQPVTVAGVGDSLRVDGNQDVTLTVTVATGSDGAFMPLAPQTTTVTALDENVAGFTLSEVGAGTEAVEGGSPDTLRVVLTSQPVSPVVFTVSTSVPSDATLAPTSLTFDGTNWDQPRSVTFTAIDDDVVDGTVSHTITVAVDDALSDPAFTSLAVETVSAITVDNDTASFALVDTAGLSVTEAGGTDAFGVVLDRAPLSDVVFTVSSADTGEVTVAPDTLTFTPSNWSIQQNVTLTGVDDDLVDGPQVTAVTVVVNAGASDAAFAGLASQAASVTTADNDTASVALADTAGVALVATDTLSVTEAAGSENTTTFNVQLTAEPTDSVIVLVSSAAPLAATVEPDTLTFTPANWSTPQPVTVTGVDDGMVNPENRTTTVTLEVDGPLSAPEFAGETASVTVTVIDAPAASDELVSVASTTTTPTSAP